jgi:hypothetical protein
MGTKAKATFEIKNWDEKTWEGKNWKDVDGAKQTHAVVTKTYQGDIEGESTSQSLTTYNEAGSASYVTLDYVVGRIGGRSGSFVLQGNGTYDPKSGEAKTTWFVVPGSGTGELRGLRGEGGYLATHGNSQVPFSLDYYFE